MLILETSLLGKIYTNSYKVLNPVRVENNFQFFCKSFNERVFQFLIIEGTNALQRHNCFGIKDYKEKKLILDKIKQLYSSLWKNIFVSTGQ